MVRNSILYSIMDTLILPLSALCVCHNCIVVWVNLPAVDNENIQMNIPWLFSANSMKNFSHIIILITHVYLLAASKALYLCFVYGVAYYVRNKYFTYSKVIIVVYSLHV